MSKTLKTKVVRPVRKHQKGKKHYMGSLKSYVIGDITLCGHWVFLEDGTWEKIADGQVDCKKCKSLAREP